MKALLEERTGIEVRFQNLSYLTKPLRDDLTLSDYNIKSGANISALFRFPGGMFKRRIDPVLPRSNDCCMITLENFKDNGVTVLKMPCGHSMCPDALMDYAWSEVSTHKKTRVKCPWCPEEWSIDVIRRYGGATPSEIEQLELGISQNFFTSSSDINQCPKCQTYFTREDSKINNVKCVICSREQGSNYYFCWFCLRDWKNSLTSASCGNKDCNDSAKLEQLRTCGKVKVGYINIETFKCRACPSCGTIIELSSGCKHMNCKACGTEFCFICLRMKAQGSWSCGSYNTTCVEAPLQTAIPHQ